MSSNRPDELGAEIEAALQGVDLQNLDAHAGMGGAGAAGPSRRDPNLRRGTVVGVSGDIRDFALDGDVMPMLFLPHAQLPMTAMTVLVRASQPETLSAQIRAEVRQIDPALPPPAGTAVLPSVADPNPLSAAVPRTVEWLGVGLLASTLGVFGAVALGAWAARWRHAQARAADAVAEVLAAAA